MRTPVSSVCTWVDSCSASDLPMSGNRCQADDSSRWTASGSAARSGLAGALPPSREATAGRSVVTARAIRAVCGGSAGRRFASRVIRPVIGVVSVPYRASCSEIGSGDAADAGGPDGGGGVDG